MPASRSKNLVKYVVPTMLGSVSFFLFTIVDGIFVGRGVGTNALGAVNLMMPFVMIVNALFQLATIGGVTVVAIRFGRGDSHRSVSDRHDAGFAVPLFSQTRKAAYTRLQTSGVAVPQDRRARSAGMYRAVRHSRHDALDE